jgi:hypothetical protein
MVMVLVVIIVMISWEACVADSSESARLSSGSIPGLGVIYVSIVELFVGSQLPCFKGFLLVLCRVFVKTNISKLQLDSVEEPLCGATVNIYLFIFTYDDDDDDDDDDDSSDYSDDF